MYESPSKAKELTQAEIEAWNMWMYKQHGIMPNQYHYFYDQGDTLLYEEHIQDLLTIDKIWQNKVKRDQQKAEAKAKAKSHHNPLSGGGGQKSSGLGGGFYGNTFKYDQ